VYRANEVRPHGHRLPYAAFHNDAVNAHMDLGEDFTIWRRAEDQPGYRVNPNHISFVGARRLHVASERRLSIASPAVAVSWLHLGRAIAA